ncbi:glutamate receptor ionotropic, kainate 2-like isoform X1 [Biomphalaria glabrata]|uniref:Glutamate receptor ionotropic, kainate 2-like isoform X1 n=1 Tax=Biomphalaria glabrata TaxID=6526 RepID=A0A9W3B1Q9_BIOGL|nr:glutamate receptor ionotropic, kainate 2-like isoform X1 [Biomphalaria glabrata]XP_055893400.1 glutamate receptor ionotropic, kainate 2-like isoform X1 [Biomphalaria glabrata]XP_055893401.1 glutamate receptor ionotropic, kainate 2-like isoform X1 [Biomphalaria glabrata]XP_055893402.1 glutamate receptor ionotropic, kainate 2-like isoform X1 [Biomphalaria glabrata]
MRVECAKFFGRLRLLAVWTIAVGLSYLTVNVLAMEQEVTMVRIGVLPSWSNVIGAAQRHNNSDMSSQFILVDLNIINAKTLYEKIDKVYKTIKASNVHVVIGPYDSAYQLATESLQIPYLSTSAVAKNAQNEYTFQVLPEMKWSADAILDIVQAYGWSRISLFYDDEKGISVLERLMTNHSMTVKAWRLPNKASNGQRQSIRDALVEMRKVLIETTVVLCSKETVNILLDQARDLAMLSIPPYGWLFYDPGDDIKILFESYRDISCNFTVLTLLPFNFSLPSGSQSRLNYSLASDALKLVSSAYNIIAENTQASNNSLTDISLKFWMNRVLRNSNVTGLTGMLQFNAHGRRNNFYLTLTSFTGVENYLRGYWYSEPYVMDLQLKFFDIQYAVNITSPFPLKGRKAQVVMIEEKPFTSLKRDHMLLKGNNRFEGFAVELIADIAEMLDFEYEIYLVNDGKFGNKLPNGEWNGMIGELLAGNATMSVAPLSINAQREEAIDFTKPFKTRYISVLMKIPTRETSYFEFLNPLSPVVWICTMCAFVIVSVILYILERVGRSKDTQEVEITVRESFWFIFGSLLQGNTDSTPTTIPGRILTSAWWFFALILISSYTANLAAFLTVKKINTPIKSVTDLAQQTKIKYGTVKDSGIMSFFKNTNIEHFAKMWAQMSEIEPGSMVDNTTEGFKKIKTDDYAFFWDTTVNKFQTLIDCEVMEIGPYFDPKGFGIGVPPGATYKEELSMAILRLSDKGRLHELEAKWWYGGNCPDLSKASADETSSLQIENVAGVFFILVGGIIFAAIVCMGEYFANAMIKASRQASGKKRDDKKKETYAGAVQDPAEKDSFL